MESKKCQLYDRECIDCGECMICDLDPNKKCDNCMKCVTHGADYRAISVNGFMLEKELQTDDVVPSASPASVSADDGLDWDALMDGYDA